MSGHSFPTEQILTMLTAGPPRIAALTVGLLPAQLLAAPSDGGWSANQILAHLRACADMWGSSIAEILAHDKPTIRAINPTTWIKRTDYLDQAFQPSLEAFTTQRTDLLAVLTPLPAEAWARTAIVTGAGKPLERSVHFYAQWLATHERSHLKPIERIAKSMRTTS